jgi:hypothetical protein
MRNTALLAAFGVGFAVNIRCGGTASPRLLATFEPSKNVIDGGICATTSTNRSQFAAEDSEFNVSASAADYFRNGLRRDETQLSRERKVSNFWGEKTT